MVRFEQVFAYKNRMIIIHDYMDQKSMSKIIQHGWESYSEDFVRYTLFKVAQGLSKMH